jgi:hypothetical protein
MCMYVLLFTYEEEKLYKIIDVKFQAIVLNYKGSSNNMAHYKGKIFQKCS